MRVRLFRVLVSTAERKWCNGRKKEKKRVSAAAVFLGLLPRTRKSKNRIRAEGTGGGEGGEYITLSTHIKFVDLAAV